MRIRYKLAGAPLAYTLSRLPEGVAAHDALHRALWSASGAVPGRLKELVFLRSSQLNECELCVRHHEATARRAGVSEEAVAAVADPGRWASTFDDGEQAALELASAMATGTGHLPPDLVERLRASFGEVELAELIAVAGEANFNNRISNAAKSVLRGDG